MSVNVTADVEASKEQGRQVARLLVNTFHPSDHCVVLEGLFAVLRPRQAAGEPVRDVEVAQQVQLGAKHVRKVLQLLKRRGLITETVTQCVGAGQRI